MPVGYWPGGDEWIRWLDQIYDQGGGTGPGGSKRRREEDQQDNTTTLQRARMGGKVNNRDVLDDIGLFEAFALDEQRDMLFGRGQEDELRSLANRAGAEEKAKEARRVAAKGANIDRATFARATKGLDLSERQKGLADRTGGLTRALASADAGTQSRRQTTDLAIGARRGLQQIEEGAFGAENAGNQMLANARGARIQRNIADEAAEDQARMGLFGTVIGAFLGGL